MNDLDLPVEIRRPNAALVTRTLSSKAVQLDPGQYFVTTRLPAGQEITRPVELSAEPETLLLEPDPEDAPAHEWDEERHFLDPERPDRAPESSQWIGSPPTEDEPSAPALESAEGPLPTGTPLPMAPDVGPVVSLTPGRAYLRVVSGNLLETELRLEPVHLVLAREQHEQGRIVYYRLREGVPMVVQFLEVDAPALNLVVPPQGRIAVSRRLPSEPGSRSPFRIEVLADNPTANLLLRYSREGAFQRAGAAADSERLLSEKITDPVGAAVGAYSLLRVGELERLHDWTNNLCEWFPWLPDGAAVQGEHLARLGRHAEALKAFSELPARGLPIVADGLFYAAERLMLYSGLKSEHARGLDTELAFRILEKLDRYVGYVHRQRPLTSYPGLDPSRPDLRPLRASQKVRGALEQSGLEAGPAVSAVT